MKGNRVEPVPQAMTVESPERKENVGLDALAEGGVGHHHRGVCHVEAALRTDEADFAVVAAQLCLCVSVEAQHHGVVAADDEQGR